MEELIESFNKLSERQKKLFANRIVSAYRKEGESYDPDYLVKTIGAGEALGRTYKFSISTDLRFDITIVFSELTIDFDARFWRSFPAVNPLGECGLIKFTILEHVDLAQFIKKFISLSKNQLSYVFLKEDTASNIQMLERDIKYSVYYKEYIEADVEAAFNAIKKA